MRPGRNISAQLEQRRLLRRRGPLSMAPAARNAAAEVAQQIGADRRADRQRARLCGRDRRAEFVDGDAFATRHVAERAPCRGIEPAARASAGDHQVAHDQPAITFRDGGQGHSPRRGFLIVHPLGIAPVRARRQLVPWLESHKVPYGKSLRRSRLWRCQSPITGFTENPQFLRDRLFPVFDDFERELARAK